MHQTNNVSGGHQSHETDLAVLPGALDGVTIMRYAHIHRTRISGGLEQYLRCLNEGLLQRNRLTILQMHLVREDESDTIEIEKIGQGRILWVPVRTHDVASRITGLWRRIGPVYHNARGLQKQVEKNKFHATLSALPRMFAHRGGHFRYNTTVFSDHLPGLLKQYDVNLLVMHWFSYDSEGLLLNALRTNIPFAFVNHFANSRLSLPQNRYWIDNAAAIGLVSDRGIPIDFQRPYTNLSDAVDTEFFRPEKARQIQLPNAPMILLPARIHAGKGHRDLIEAIALLIATNSDFSLCFAGVVDSEDEHRELREIVAAAGLQERVSFLGEQTAVELRDLYASSCMVVLPSHSEGLGKVLLEAQAMRKPVIAYDSGGMSQAFLNDETGFLVKTGDIQALADKIRFLLDNADQSGRLGIRGREFVTKNFAIPALIQRHEAFYLKALSKLGVNRT
jgi:glycosyltransferase involved in cell wall biosynthesis